MASLVLRNSTTRLLMFNRHVPFKLLACSSSTSSQKNILQEQINQWKQANDMFNSPERDTKNFPVHKLQDFVPAYRLGFIPESFFTAFYNKTGVTGPYVLGVSGLTFLMSKEYLVWNETVAHGAVFAGLMWWIMSKWGPAISNFIDENTKSWFDEFYYKSLRTGRDEVVENVKVAQQLIAELDAKNFIVEAKKENLALQLEAQYRQRLQHAHDEVRRKLNYQIDKIGARQRYEQTHMVQWIDNQVAKAITPQLEQQYMDSCIGTLKNLAASAK